MATRATMSMMITALFSLTHARLLKARGSRIMRIMFDPDQPCVAEKQQAESHPG
jgi:hypothetical protein